MILYDQYGVVIIRTFNWLGLKNIFDFLEEKFPTKAKKYLAILTTATKESFVNQEEKELLKLAIEIEKNRKLKNLFIQGNLTEINDQLNNEQRTKPEGAGNRLSRRRAIKSKRRQGGCGNFKGCTGRQGEGPT